ncbi:DUF2934 domain-containing protein [Shinella curvata]|uniref:DUF2934 domain-containing protein n=1 Tax=Shinella curvata TaxID=1817964 RepID=A0ABT8XMY8_9HYPH|nr:DUF2934 domain-containing protein [Shinella curvata]MCJ8056579.1 DUF2934 domain-containing protein [Shinella curvata]MDO6125107.1 DUF2934 domain-containing protein [Shinella curvata]
MSDEKRLREDAYARWEAEGRPDGQHERHWREASDALQSSVTPQTWSADHGSGVGSRDPSSGESCDEGIRPEKLNSENDQGAG